MFIEQPLASPMSTNYQVYKYDLADIDEDTLGELNQDDECKRANINIKNICLGYPNLPALE